MKKRKRKKTWKRTCDDSLTCKIRFYDKDNGKVERKKKRKKERKRERERETKRPQWINTQTDRNNRSQTYGQADWSMDGWK